LFGFTGDVLACFWQDPSQHNDLATALPQLKASMSARLDELAKGFYSNQDNFPVACPSTVQARCWGGEGEGEAVVVAQAKSGV
jgi:hypothetical protein